MIFASIAINKIPFHGFKTRMIETANDHILNYVITVASVDDAKIVSKLIDGWPYPDILADIGYVGKNLKLSLKTSIYSTSWCSSMKSAKRHNKRQIRQYSGR